MTRCPHCGQTHGGDNHFCGVTGQPLDLGPRLLGQVILDRFEIRSLVGEGPVAVVLEAADRQQNGASVAVKMLHPQLTRDAAATERFLTEARRVGDDGFGRFTTCRSTAEFERSREASSRTRGARMNRMAGGP